MMTVTDSDSAAPQAVAAETPSPLVSAPTTTTSTNTITNTFAIPQRRIITPDDLTHFHQSQIHADFFGFIEACSDAVSGLKISDSVHDQSATVQHLLTLLNTIEATVDQTPAEPDPKSRFGNPAFRLFYDKVQVSLPEWLAPLVQSADAIPEVAKYLEKSFGDRKRIDYGTGHEANFMAFLLCLWKLDLLTSSDLAAVILRVFVRYITLMRKIQFTYWLEPAGSHGVWGLDDYHSLPFLFGASQLVPHKHLRPRAIRNAEIVDEFANDYLYFSCIQFINRVKPTASLRWHSPMLDDISSAKSWAKVEAGMRKMYRAEVLGKLPIMQHFMFGTILRFDNVSGRVVKDEDLEADDGHLHVYAMGQQFPDCCGMRLPSAIAAKEREGRANRSALPFD
ncbi:Serine/threonine-protein phosphatase 2A activator 2 (ppiase PTPA-2)(Rotamase PTPA-2) [Catenaria anguillulae PL171]|uniref:Serine/threonine-protein phosphatase 2A activator n=1 Tax=Catenaria anguillulae PL171 TaxID=765915 RepID=A0A1Y2HQ11_9FUNG|nr:Serine/threonine-protein phosphatase 2A activator 2 (ppiase PTPA-2)(Rotamase PTPA-2) [Catenaria anguillulae PL171]